MREESRWGGGWVGAGRAVPVVLFIYSWCFQCAITHIEVWAILLIETQLKPCVSNLDRLRGKQKGEGCVVGVVSWLERDEQKHSSCSWPYFFFYYFYFLWCPHCCLLLQPPLASMNNEKETSIELFPCFAAWTHTSVSKLFEQTSNHQVFLFFDFCPPFQLALSCIPNTSVLGESSAMDLDVWAVIACGRKLGFLEKFQVEFGLTQTELNAKLWVLEAKITDTMQMWLSLKHLFKLSTHQMLESLPIISPRAPRFPASGQDSVHRLRPLFNHFFLPPALHMPCAIHARSTTGPLASVDIGSNCFCFAFASMPISDQTDLFSCLIPQFHLDNP